MKLLLLSWPKESLYKGDFYAVPACNLTKITGYAKSFLDWNVCSVTFEVGVYLFVSGGTSETFSSRAGENAEAA